MRRWKAHRGKIASLSFSRDGQFLASVTGSGRDIFIWDATADKLVRKLTVEDVEGKPPLHRASGVSFSHDAEFLAVARQHWAEVWDCRTWTRFGAASYEFDTFGAVELGPGTQPAMAVSTALDVHVFRLPAASDSVAWPPLLWDVRNEFHSELSFSADGLELAMHTFSGIEIREALSGKWLRDFDHSRGNYAGPVRFSPDSSRLAFCYAKTIESHPATLDDPDAIIRYSGHTDKVWMLRYTPDGRRLISASSDGTVREWEAATGAEIRCFEWKVGKIAAADVSPDGMTAAVGGTNGEIVVWDLD